jgi:hypothetical protein
VFYNRHVRLSHVTFVMVVKQQDGDKKECFITSAPHCLRWTLKRVQWSFCSVRKTFFFSPSVWPDKFRKKGPKCSKITNPYE